LLFLCGSFEINQLLLPAHRLLLTAAHWLYNPTFTIRMRIHHFFPRTKNVGDHFVQIGIASLLHAIDSNASIELFDVNSRGADKKQYGLTQQAIEKANREADLVVVGGSNLYGGAFGWPWGVHLQPDALKSLRVPLFLIGIGSGSAFDSQIHKPSKRARAEIRLLNEKASLSWVRDNITLKWLQELGVSKGMMLGDPATYIFNNDFRPVTNNPQILLVVPPARIWKSRRSYWKSKRRGRPIFNALAVLARQLLNAEKNVVVACNDPRELELASQLFQPLPVICPQDPHEYFQLLSASGAVISGRLHTAAVALSLGIPFLLLDLDKRTRGFIETYQLDQASLQCSDVSRALPGKAEELLGNRNTEKWMNSITTRNSLYGQAQLLLQAALTQSNNHTIASPKSSHNVLR
jgi:polysaccharide pyruvyl transferase WcaK-like protein